MNISDTSSSLAPHGIASPPSRRDCMLVAGAAGLLSALPAQAQAVSAAAEAAKAPPLPALDSVLTLPRFAMLDGSVFEPSGSSGKPLLVYWWSSTCTFCALWKYFPIQV